MGKATTAELVHRGCEVIGVDVRNADVVADLASPADRQRAVEEICARSDNRIDGVVTFAGISGFGGAGGDEVVAVDYFGTVTLLEALRPALAAGTVPAAVAVSSNAATITPRVDEALVDACLDGDEVRACTRGAIVGGAAAYAAAKLAVARWVRREAPGAAWVGRGITLNAVVPGVIDTPMTRAMRRRADAATMIDRTPLPAGRAGTAQEVAELAAFLLGPSARYIVGSLIFVDGGTDAVIRADTPSPRPARRHDGADSASSGDE